MKILKKALSIALCATLLASIIGLTSIATYNPSDFNIVNSILTKYIGSSRDVVIPDNLGIKEIGHEAFWANYQIKSVVIPEGVTSIDDGAFGSCKYMTSI